jgi:cardiolipin synthase
VISPPPRTTSEENPWFRVEGSKVRLLRDGAQTFPAMLEAIAAAKREVVLEYYWIAPSAIGRRFRDALAERAANGVTVRVIYDSLGSRRLGPEWWQSLQDAGGHVREYNSILPFHDTFRLDRLMQRDHRKLLVVDGDAGFIGGVNIGDEWVSLVEGGAGWRDHAVAVRGEVALEMRSLFYRTWRRVTHERPPTDLAPLTPPRGRAAYVLASQRRRRRSIHHEYRARIDAAHRSVDLAHSYFYPDVALRRSIFRAAERGVRVRVLLPEISDVPGLQFFVEAMFDTFLRHGLEIYSLPPPMLHSKLAIVDRRFVTIGSYNLDEGLRKNLEANVAIVDEAFAAHVAMWFERDLAQATRIDASVVEKRSFVRRGAEWLALTARGLW